MARCNKAEKEAACLRTGCFSLLGFTNKDIQNERNKCQSKEHHECGGIATGDLQHLIGYSGNERATHDSKRHKCHIGREMLHAEE